MRILAPVCTRGTAVRESGPSRRVEPTWPGLLESEMGGAKLDRAESASYAQEMGEPKEEQDFNWIEARHLCSPFGVFAELRKQAESDVAIRNAQEQEVRFRVDRSPDCFRVIREAKSLSACTPASVEFRWTASGIEVSNDTGIILQGALTVNDEGKCRLRVKERELTFWQFRRRALEDLFFNYGALTDALQRNQPQPT